MASLKTTLKLKRFKTLTSLKHRGGKKGSTTRLSGLEFSELEKVDLIDGLLHLLNALSILVGLRHPYQQQPISGNWSPHSKKISQNIYWYDVHKSTRPQLFDW